MRIVTGKATGLPPFPQLLAPMGFDFLLSLLIRENKLLIFFCPATRHPPRIAVTVDNVIATLNLQS